MKIHFILVKTFKHLTTERGSLPIRMGDFTCYEFFGQKTLTNVYMLTVFRNRSLIFFFPETSH